MKTHFSFAKYSILGFVAIVICPLSACGVARNESVPTAPLGYSRDAGILPQVDGKVRLEGLRFVVDGARVQRRSKAILDAAAEILRDEPDQSIFVDAYCDQAGSKRANRLLAHQRAEKVKQYLEAKGIPPERMIARGFSLENSGAHIVNSRTSKQNSQVELIPFPSQ
jgi:outer membrane protein OmpA-like peptidoglycan-associated protein